MAALKYWVWLTALPGLSNRSRLLLLERYGSPEDVYYADAEELALTEGLTPGQAQLLSDKSLTRADRILADCARGDIFLLTMQDAAYPARLRDIFDPPVLLYGKGSLPLFDEEAAIAVVGTRSCTPYGLRCAHRMGYELARQGAVVVSGMAKGIDGAAMRGALQAGGFTAAVLGGGVDVVYPAENRRLYEDIAATGVLLSEYPPGTEPLPGHFPVRNRIISGLSLASLVVEAPVRSGALITAHAALDQGRDVFAVPGSIFSPASAGTNALLRDGRAKAVCTAADLFGTLGLQTARPAPAPRETPRPLSENERLVLSCLGAKAQGVEELGVKSGLPTAALLGVLMKLELAGRVSCLPGKRYILRGGSAS